VPKPLLVVNGIAAESRLTRTTEHLEVGEDPTACVYDGFRTTLLKTLPDGRRYERCPHCLQTYLVSDAEEPDESDDDDPLVHGGDAGDIEVLDGAGRVVGMTNAGLDDLLHQMTGELPEASQTDLNHLFGIETPDYPDFGSF
jgi:hypothetical protein